jgi:hypothetical protein
VLLARLLNTVNKIVRLEGAGSASTCLNWTGSSAINGAIVINSTISGGGYRADEITVSAPCERVDLEALKATKARRKGAER